VRLPVRVRYALATMVAATAAVALTAAGPGAGTQAAAGPRPAAAPAPAAPGQVLLVNGDRVTVRSAPDGRSAISDLPAARGDSLVSLHHGGVTETIPSDALPYLGHGLDPSLFDLAALQRAEAGGRLPLRVTYQGSRPDLPGLTVTSAAQGSADGYLTASSARAFGAALRRQFQADRARGSYGGSGLFASGADIALAGAPAPPVRPDFPMHTLTVTGTGLSGKPDTGDIVWVFDAENLTAYQDIGLLYHGVVKFSVPAGRYWVVGEYDSFTASAPVTHLAFLPQFAVDANTTVHVAEQSANSEVTMAVPRPANAEDVVFTASIGDSLGNSEGIGWFNAPGSIWVSPMNRKPAVGTLQADASEQLTSPSSAAVPYVYNLDYADPAGIIPAQHYRAQPARLAAITDRYYQDVPSTGAFTTFGAFPNQGFLGFTLTPLALPGRLVQYYSTASDLVWSADYNSFVPADGFPSGGAEDAYRVLRAGEKQVVDWNRYPLHPQPDVAALGAARQPFPVLPSAIRSGNTLTVTTTPFSDNQPGHLAVPATDGTTVTESYEVDQDGVQIAAGDAFGGVPAVTLSGTPSLVTFTLRAARTGPSYRLSDSSQTVWTWRSKPQPGATVPAPWYCSYVLSGGQYVPLHTCDTEPMMTLSYQVRGLALDGTTAPGRQVISLHVGHIQPAAAPRVARAAAQVSCDGGQSWQRAAVRSAGHGNYLVGFGAPSGCDVTLRVSAKDAAGGSITETIDGAYGVTS
jgi:hypothetical protein